MQTKAFTLVELLAVITILGIISAIAIPKVINIIENSKYTAFKNSINNVFHSYEIYRAENEFDDIGKISIKDEYFPIKSKLKSGQVYINENEEIEVEKVTDETYCASGTKKYLSIIKGTCQELEQSKVKINISEISTSKITIKIETEDEIESYYAINSENYKKGEKIYTFDKLKAGTMYKIYVKVKTKNNIETILEKEVTTNILEVPTYIVDKSGWARSKKVTIKYPEEEGLIYEYSLDKGITWNTGEQNQEIEFQEEGSIIGRVSDGTNQAVSKVFTVDKIDKTSPLVTINQDKEISRNNEPAVFKNIEIGNATNISCNNGAIPTIEGNKLSVSNVTTDTTCSLNNTLKTAIDNADTSYVNIIMVNDETNVSSVIENNRKIILNLNNKKLSGAVNLFYVRETGELTINGNGLIYSTSETNSWNGVIKMHGSGGAKLTINANGCNSTDLDKYSSGLLMYSKANAVISNYGIMNEGSGTAEININGGCYYSEQREGIQLRGDTIGNIKNVKIISSSNGIDSRNTSINLTLTNNNVESTGGFALYSENAGIVNVNIGKYKSTSNGPVVGNYGSGTINLNSSNISNEDNPDGDWHQIGIRNNSNGIINIKDTTVDSVSIAIYNNAAGTINIKSGLFTEMSKNGSNYTFDSVVYNNYYGGFINICGGTFEGRNNDIRQGINNGTFDGKISYKSSGINWINGTTPSVYLSNDNYTVDNSITCE